MRKCCQQDHFTQTGPRPAQQAQDQERSLPDQDHEQRDQNHILLDRDRSCNKTKVSDHISGSSLCCIVVVQVQCSAHVRLDTPWIV